MKIPTNPMTRENVDKIIQVLRESRDGLWISQIAEKIGLTKPIVHYCIFGQRKMTKKFGEKLYGAYLKDEIEDEREGRNRKVWLRRGGKR